VCNSGDDHKPPRVVDGVDDSIVADPDAEIVTAGELDRAVRPRVSR
jgi:hypothetical protein